MQRAGYGGESSSPRRRDSIVVRQVEDQFVLYDPATDRTALLDVQAAAVFDLCDGTRTPEQIAREISELLALGPGEVAAEVERVLKILRVRGFLG